MTSEMTPQMTSSTRPDLSADLGANTSANTSADPSAFIGAGISYRHRYREGLLSPPPPDGPPPPRALEVMTEHFFRDPSALDALADAYPLCFHEVNLSPATTWDDGPILRRVQALVRRAQPLMFTEHLSISHSPDGLSLGHLAPIWYTQETLDALCDRVRRWQDALCVPIALETITAPFFIPHADMDEASFLHALTARTGCGVLFDLTNLLITSQNFGFDPLQRLRDYPLDAVWAVHLSGGHLSDGLWIDSHAAPVSDQSWSLLSTLRALALPNLRAIFIERDGAWPPLTDLCAEAATAHQLWTHPNP
jgi:uncharacterized protein